MNEATSKWAAAGHLAVWYHDETSRGQKGSRTDAEKEIPSEEEHALAWGDIAGEELDAAEVKRARKEEIDYFRKMGVYKKVPIEQCWSRTGKGPTPARWADINKGDQAWPSYRSRFVAKDKAKFPPGSVRGHPALEALKVVLAFAAQGKDNKVMVSDIQRAYFYAPAVREVYVQLCSEDQEQGDEHRCGLLQCSVYGARGAAHDWQAGFTAKLLEAGFVRGKSSP